MEGLEVGKKKGGRKEKRVAPELTLQPSRFEKESCDDFFYRLTDDLGVEKRDGGKVSLSEKRREERK